jgi:tetratricopeptide (TPR) repeat protein
VTFETMRQSARSALSSGLPDSANDAEDIVRDYLAGGISDRDRGLASNALAEILVMQGLPDEAGEFYSGAYALVTSADDRLAVLCGYAIWVRSEEKRTEAQNVYNELAAVLQSCEVSQNCVWGYAYLSKVARFLGRTNDAVKFAKQAITMSSNVGVEGRSEALSALSEALESIGDIDGAMEALDDALSFMQEGHCKMNAEAKMAELSLMVGDKRRAIISLTKAVEGMDARNAAVMADVTNAIAKFGKVDPVAAVELMGVLATQMERLAHRKRLARG